MIDQLMRDAVEHNRPPSVPNLAIILAKGRARRRRARIAQVGAAVITAGTVAGAVAMGHALQSHRIGPPTTGTSPAPTSSPTPADIVASHLDPGLVHLVRFGADGSDNYMVVTFDWFDGPKLGQSTWRDAENAWLVARRRGEQVQPLRNGKVNLAFAAAETALSSNERHRVSGAHKNCAVAPRRVLGPPMTWMSCTTVNLSDGTILLEARSTANGVQTIGVTHILTDGSKVSLSVSTGGDLENPSNDSTGIPLTELPVTMNELRDTVLDPHMPPTLPAAEAQPTDDQPAAG